MAVKSNKLGPGSLKIGETGSEQEWAFGVRKLAIEPDVEDGDVLPVLSGDEIDEGETESAKLTGEILQSYDADSFIAYTWKYANQVLPFTFRPDNDKALAVTGSVKIRRAVIGGDVKARNTSEFEWPIRNGMPKLIDAETQAELVYTPTTPAPEMPDVDDTAWD